MELPTPRLTTTPLGRLRAVQQLSILRKVHAWNRRGVNPTRYVVAKGVAPRSVIGSARGYPYQAIDKLLRYGLLCDLSEDKFKGSELLVTEVGLREIQYWDANPILAQDGR